MQSAEVRRRGEHCLTGELQSHASKHNEQVVPLGSRSCSSRLHWWSKSTLVGLLVILCVLYLLPSPIKPIAFKLSPYKETEMNSELKKTKRLFENEIHGPESFVVDKDGNVYTGLNDGRVIRFTDTSVETVLRLGQPPYDKHCDNAKQTVCSRPLGLAIASSTAPYDLYIADCYHGILVYNLMTKELTTLLNSTIPRKGIPPMKLINSIALLSNGSIFFTDSSGKFDRDDALLDMLEGTGNGKLMHYNPYTESLSVVVSDIAFANGLCLSPSEEFLLIAETTRSRIIRYYLSGPKAGTTDIFADNLIGIPDNITPASSGGYWVGAAASRHTGVFDSFSQYPWLRDIFAKLHISKAVHSLIPKTGLIYRLSADGEVQEMFWDSDGAVIEDVSSVLDMGNSTLYLGSHTAPYIGRLDLE